MKVIILLAGGVLLLTASASSAQPGPGMGGGRVHGFVSAASAKNTFPCIWGPVRAAVETRLECRR